MTKVKYIIFITVWLCLFRPIVFAAPSISSTSGTVFDGGSIVISGSGFGSKSTAAPLKYDDFEQIGGDYDIGDQIADDWNYRTGATNDIAKYNNTDVRTGSTKQIRNIIPTWSPAGRFWYAQGENLTELYVTCWYKLNVDYGNDCGGSKFFAVYSTDVGENLVKPVYDALAAVEPDESGWFYMNMRDENGNWVINSTNWEGGAFPEDRWIRLEYYIKESSFNGQEDGILRVWAHRNPGVSAVSKEKDINCETNCDGCTKHFKAVVFSLWFYNGDCIRTIDHDDIYIDNTQSRVEIGDNVVWADCTHREIQIPTAWAAGEVTITVNQGSFGDSDSAYLFVVDSDGNASSGEPITFGSGGSSISIPGNLTGTIN